MQQMPKARSDVARENINSVVLSSRNEGVLTITAMTRLLSMTLAAALTLMMATLTVLTSSISLFKEKTATIYTKCAIVYLQRQHFTNITNMVYVDSYNCYDFGMGTNKNMWF